MALALALLVLAADSTPAPDKPRLFVSALTAQGVEPELARGMTDAVADALSVRGLFHVITTKDLETLLGVERQKQLLGVCASDAAACSQSAADAVTARFVLSGQLSKLGSVYQLSLQMVDTEKGQPVARSLRLSDDLGKLQALVPYAAAEATGSPRPPPPSKVLPISLVAAGGAAFLAGAVLGMLALSRQAVVNEELCPSGAPAIGRCDGVALRPRDYYLAQEASIGTQKSVALALLLGGATLAVLGLVLWPASDTQGVRVSFLPSLTGLAVAGAF
jgi:TolB-like protein